MGDGISDALDKGWGQLRADKYALYEQRTDQQLEQQRVINRWVEFSPVDSSPGDDGEGIDSGSPEVGDARGEFRISACCHESVDPDDDRIGEVSGQASGQRLEISVPASSIRRLQVGIEQRQPLDDEI